MRFSLYLMSACLALSLDLSAQARKTDVDLKAPDGVTLRGSHYSPGAAAPAVLLIHQCNMDRRAWDPFAAALANAGFHVLTPDLRGFGDSGRARANQKWAADLDAWLGYLTSHAEVDRERVAAGGASCGSVEAALLASRSGAVKALVLLSGGAGAALSHIAGAPSLPVFGAAAEGDRDAGATRAAVEASRNPHSNLRIIDGNAHGVPMFAANPDLVALIVQWLHDQLSAPRR